jgi:hypothetical protein
MGAPREVPGCGGKAAMMLLGIIATIAVLIGLVS